LAGLNNASHSFNAELLLCPTEEDELSISSPEEEEPSASPEEEELAISPELLLSAEEELSASPELLLSAEDEEASLEELGDKGSSLPGNTKTGPSEQDRKVAMAMPKIASAGLRGLFFIYENSPLKYIFIQIVIYKNFGEMVKNPVNRGSDKWE